MASSGSSAGHCIEGVFSGIPDIQRLDLSSLKNPHIDNFGY
jgi:hypothetical protein